jgi:hypothetical protein
MIVFIYFIFKWFMGTALFVAGPSATSKRLPGEVIRNLESIGIYNVQAGAVGVYLYDVNCTRKDLYFVRADEKQFQVKAYYQNDTLYIPAEKLEPALANTLIRCYRYAIDYNIITADWNCETKQSRIKQRDTAFKVNYQ